MMPWLRTFADIDHDERECYQKITEILKSFCFSFSLTDYLAWKETPSSQTSAEKFQRGSRELTQLCHAIQPLYDTLITLQKEHAALSKELAAAQSPIWTKEIIADEKIIPTDPMRSSTEFLTEQFFYLIHHVIDYSALSSENQDHINSYLLKIIACPIGQRLIVKMNRRQRELQTQHPEMAIRIRLASQEGLFLQVEHAPLKTIERRYAFSSCPVSDAVYYKNLRQFHDPCPELIIGYPQNYHQKALSFAAGTDTCLTLELPFISLFHELIHALHYWRGRCRLGINMRDPLSATYHLFWRPSLDGSDAEEYRTIMLAHTNENQLRAFCGLPSRGGYLGASSNESSFYSDSLKIIALIQAKREKTSIPPLTFLHGF